MSPALSSWAVAGTQINAATRNTRRIFETNEVVFIMVYHYNSIVKKVFLL
jgi:hypothetical protein